MEGVIPAMNGFKRPGADIEGSPAKKTTFVGLSPLNKLTNVKTPTDRPFRVSIEGNIGAGKSTLIEYFKHIQGIETYAVSHCQSANTYIDYLSNLNKFVLRHTIKNRFLL